MNDIQNILKKKEIKVNNKLCKYEWQQIAKDIIEEFNVPKEKVSSVFQLCKREPNLVSRVRAYCKEGGVCNIGYFFKMVNVFKQPCG